MSKSLFEIEFFFGDGRDSNPRPYTYYALSIPTELSSRGQLKLS